MAKMTEKEQEKRINDVAKLWGRMMFDRGISRKEFLQFRVISEFSVQGWNDAAKDQDDFCRMIHRVDGHREGAD